jgi:hypothetical protein
MIGIVSKLIRVLGEKVNSHGFWSWTGGGKISKNLYWKTLLRMISVGAPFSSPACGTPSLVMSRSTGATSRTAPSDLMPWCPKTKALATTATAPTPSAIGSEEGLGPRLFAKQSGLERLLRAVRSTPSALWAAARGKDAGAGKDEAGASELISSQTMAVVEVRASDGRTILQPNASQIALLLHVWHRTGASAPPIQGLHTIQGAASAAAGRPWASPSPPPPAPTTPPTPPPRPAAAPSSPGPLAATAPPAGRAARRYGALRTCTGARA